MDSRALDELLDMDLALDGDDWVPTPHGRFMGQMLAEHGELVRGQRCLELGAGTANHTVLLVRQGAASIVATEITADRLETTRSNVERNCPDADNVEYRVADWLNTEGRFDVIVTNPPFAKSGKQNRRYFIDALILDGHKRLEPEGRLVFVQSSMADLARTRRWLDRNGYSMRIVGRESGPFRDYYFEDESFLEEIRRVKDGFEVRDGTHYETLYVIEATLRPWTPPPGAHQP